jgi:hypothetical protein
VGVLALLRYLSELLERRVVLESNGGPAAGRLGSAGAPDAYATVPRSGRLELV